MSGEVAWYLLVGRRSKTDLRVTKGGVGRAVCIVERKEEK